MTLTNQQAYLSVSMRGTHTRTDVGGSSSLGFKKSFSYEGLDVWYAARFTGNAGATYTLNVLTGATTGSSAAVAAALTTALTGTNNDMVFTADTAGTAGNNITIAYVNPGVETASESVSVIGSAITVTLRSVSSVLSTAAQVKTALDASGAASALISVANAPGNDGTGVVTAMAATNLAGGYDAGTIESGVDFEGKALPTATEIYGFAIRCVSGSANVAETNGYYASKLNAGAYAFLSNDTDGGLPTEYVSNPTWDIETLSNGTEIIIEVLSKT